MQRYKRIFDNTMKACALLQQKAEAWISASTLNRMTSLGMPVPVKNLTNVIKNGGDLAKF